VQFNPPQRLSLLQLSSLPSSQPNALPPLQSTLTRRTNGHCMWTFIAVNLALFPLLNTVSRTTHALSVLSVSLSGFKGLMVSSEWRSRLVHLELRTRNFIMATRSFKHIRSFVVFSLRFEPQCYLRVTRTVLFSNSAYCSQCACVCVYGCPLALTKYIISLNSNNQSIFVIQKCCFLWVRKLIFKFLTVI
jgi:hypothetical protein